jgi:dTDP-4-dehydrorhamnose 3,5-epimerase
VILREQAIAGVFEVEPEPATDERGLFARTFAAAEFAEHGLPLTVTEASVSFNARRGTLRGLHLQVAPHEEAKLVRCLAGRVHDVVVDLRAGSPTQLAWLAIELSSARRNAVYVPPGCAHGFLTLEEACELEYLISAAYAPAAAAGVRWDDPAVAIEWPAEPHVISPRDAAFPALDAARVRREGPAGLVAAEEASR